MASFVVFRPGSYRVVIQLCILVFVDRARLRWAPIPVVSVPSRRVVSVVRVLCVKVSAL